jgi:hypothetical protein
MLALPDVEGTTAVRTDINKKLYFVPSRCQHIIKLGPTPDASIQSVNGQTGTVLLTKADLSLAVNNTSDADKPLSSAATEAINLKEDVANSVDLNLDAESDLKYPSVKAVKIMWMAQSTPILQQKLLLEKPQTRP